MAAPMGAKLVEDTSTTQDTTTSSGPKGARLAPAEPTSNYNSGGSARGKVIEVHDGDTVKIQDNTGYTYNVRLGSIDAPELQQKFGKDAQKYLSDKILNKEVDFGWDELDSHGRYVGKIRHEGQDVNLDLVKGGYAHHYSRYDKSPDYASAYQDAIKNKSGLWKDDKRPQSPEAFRRDAEDPTGWKRFKFADVPAKLGREAGSVVDTVWGVVPMVVNMGGLIAETIAPVVGKDPKSVSKNTDQLIEQISDPVRKVVGGNKEKWETTGWNRAMSTLGEALDDTVIEKVADATNMTPRQKAAFADTTMIALAELTGGLLGKLKVKDRITESMTTPSSKERADYIERKSKADADFAFETKQKADEKQRKLNAEAEKAKENPAPKESTVVDKTTGEIKEVPTHINQVHTEVASELGLSSDTASKLITTDEQFGLYQSGYVSSIVNGATKAEAVQAGLRNIHEDHVISSILKDVEERKAAQQVANKINEVKPDLRKKPGVPESDKLEEHIWEYGRSTVHEHIENKLHGMSDRGLQSFIDLQTKRLSNKDKPISTDLRSIIEGEIDLAKQHQEARRTGKEPPSKSSRFEGDDLLEGIVEKTDKSVSKTKTEPIVEEQKASEIKDEKDLSSAFKQETKTPAPSDLDLQKRLWESEKPIRDAVEESNKDTQQLNALTKDPSVDKLAEYLKANEKQLKDATERYFHEAGIAPVQGIAETPRAWSEMVKDAIGVNIGNVIWANHEVKQLVKALKKLAPKAEDRVRVFEAIQRKTVDQLPEHLKAAADFYRSAMESWGKEFMDAGMLKGLLDDYATRIIETKGVDPKLIDKAFQAFREKMGPDLTEKSRFQKKRSIEAYDELLKVLDEHGLKLKTRDIAEVAQQYGQSMWKAKANKELVKYLKDFNLVDGMPIFIDATKDSYKKPFNYETIRGGQFDGYAVHPDVAKALKHVLDSKDIGMFFRGMHGLSMLTKRLNVGASLFHATTLLVGSAFTNSIKTNNYFNPVAHYKAMAEAYSNAYSSGRLKFWNDIGGRFGAELDAGVGAIGMLAKKGDEWLHKVGGFEGDYTQKTVELMAKPQKLLDHITWDVIHDGSKLMTMEALLEKAMRDHPTKTEAQLAKEVAKHVNDVYGGINWFDAARSSNKFLENMKMAAFSPQGMKFFQILEFAPDWTLSTLRVFARAIPKSILQPHKWDIAGGIHGIMKPMTAGDFARQYQMRAMLYLNLVANGLNISLSGHSIYENKDFFSIELGDGSAIHPFKHYSEAFHWMGDFTKTFVNKLGFVPRMFVKTADKTYKESVKEAASGFMPFSVTGAKKGVPEAVGGFVGVPMTGSHTGKLGGEGVRKNWERALKRAKRKLGIKDDAPKGAKLVEEE